MMTREQVLHQLAGILVSRIHPHPLRVAIDGIDAAGKTTLAGELAPLIEAQGRPVIRASIDGFLILLSGIILVKQTVEG